MKHFLSTILLLLCACMTYAGAGNFSYLYIQGDKQTPFYVKLEEGMQPRFGKNYCIIPKLAPGPAHIEILFQQNAFPAQQYTVLIPEGGSRGFLLVRSDAGFSLYDLQQGFYLQAGNKEEDDRLPVVNTAIVPASAAPSPVTAPASVAVEPGEPGVRGVEKSKSVPENAGQKKTEAIAQKTEASAGEPVFIRDMELSKGGRKDAADSAFAIPPGTTATTPAITNTDCPTPLSATEFGKIFTALSAFGADEEKLEYLGGQMNLCYETWQARTLAGKFSGDAARFELLKKIYPRITDQAAFPLLDDLLTTEAWKAAFNRLVHP